MTKTEATELIAVYTANLIAAEPRVSDVARNQTVAALVLKYAAAEVDPGQFAYYPHPCAEAESILHNASAYLMQTVRDR